MSTPFRSTQHPAQHKALMRMLQEARAAEEKRHEDELKQITERFNKERILTVYACIECECFKLVPVGVKYVILDWSRLCKNVRIFIPSSLCQETDNTS